MAGNTSPPLAASQGWWLLATAVAAMVPLTFHLPAWLSLAAAAALAWRGWRGWHRLPPLPRWILVLLVVAGCGAVLGQYRTLFGQNPGVALLVLLLSLKLLEARNTRDGLAIIFLTCFLALAQFFYAQGILTALVTMATTLVAVASMISLADPRQRPRTLLHRAATMLAQASPCMLVLFVLFPRVQGPLWGLPKDAGSSLTGLSDIMEPGSISQLSQSDAIAFRVLFAGPLPPSSRLYWRGPVLSEFDGRNWRMPRHFLRLGLPYEEPAEGGIEYEITLEAHGKPWLFALELPGRPPDEALATHDFQLLAKEPVSSRRRYTLRSYLDLHPGQEEAEASRQRLRRLPEGSNPRIRALAEGWRATARNDDEVLRLAQNFFLRQQLLYTLEPPLLGEHAADEFLFDTRQGFCEHFASAFAVALRAAGVPARVVTGYQGGEVNPVDGYLAVRQFEAHAWTEVWLPGRGWLRVDPTAITAPARIESSLAAAIPAGDQLPLLARSNLAWLRELRHRRDAVNNAWNQWVLGYNPERQRQVLRRIGFSSPNRQSMIAALAVVTAVSLSSLAVWRLRRRRRDPLLALWEKISRRLARHGLARRATEGPQDYAARVTAALPHAAGEIQALAALFSRLRYGRTDENAPALLHVLRRRTAAFRP
ncbi:MAG: hypothetical protein BWK76_22135 [Desulfobulbaceae bacterium A2]|nr:MAG: hypothetical protein BWK76_22135 [Desulfobulbaceae bacterium A2]